MFKPAILLASSAIFLAAAARAQTFDFTTPDVQKLKSDALAHRAEIGKQRTDALRTLIDGQLDRARQALSKAKVSGNITATASGNAAVKLFTDVKASFDKDGSCILVGSIRRDLEQTAEEFKRSAQSIEEKHADELKKMDQTSAARLGEVLARQKTPVADGTKRLDLWTQLMHAAPAVPAGTNAVPGAGMADSSGANAAVAIPAASTVLASSGDAANWTPLLKLEITVRDSLEVVSVPLDGITEPRSFDGVGGMGNPWQVQASPLQQLVPGNTTPAFRIQSLPPLKPVDVAEWPTARNNWTLELRARTATIPSRHGVIVETDAAACKPLVGGAPAAITPATPARGAPGPGIKVRFESQPDGAGVLFNNQPLVEQNKPLLTPFDYTVSSNPADITFRKRGYKDATLRQVFPATGKPFRVTLVEAPGFADVTIPVFANGAEWTPSGVRVKKGNQVRIAATGMWSCGSGGEMVDADGYPNNDTYFRYYVDPLQNPRLSPKTNYGQLIARILPDGEMAGVGKQNAFIAATDGEIALTINEAVNARKDNRGKVSVRVMADP